MSYFSLFAFDLFLNEIQHACDTASFTKYFVCACFAFLTGFAQNFCLDTSVFPLCVLDTPKSVPVLLCFANFTYCIFGKVKNLKKMAEGGDIEWYTTNDPLNCKNVTYKGFIMLNMVRICTCNILQH